MADEPNKPDDAPVTYTKADIDKINTEWGKKFTSIQTEFETFKTTAKLNADQLKQYEDTVKSLKAETQTREQQLQAELNTARTKATQDLENAQNQAKSWETLYTSSLIDGDIKSAAAKFKAHDGDQLVTFVKDKVVTVPVLDAEGKPTGSYRSAVRVKDKDGKDQQMSVESYVEGLTKDPKSMNLFASGVLPGLGGSGDRGKQADPSKAQSAEEYFNITRKKDVK